MQGVEIDARELIDYTFFFAFARFFNVLVGRTKNKILILSNNTMFSVRRYGLESGGSFDV